MSQASVGLGASRCTDINTKDAIAPGFLKLMVSNDVSPALQSRP